VGLVSGRPGAGAHLGFREFKNLRRVLPHPNPLPLGEGTGIESFSHSEMAMWQIPSQISEGDGAAFPFTQRVRESGLFQNDLLIF
jgi:hypothetical protein